MRGYSRLEFKSPIRDAVSRVRFAPHSNNLLISSWDCNLRLYDVDSSLLRLEAYAPAGILDCCFESESAAYSAGSDGCIRRYDLNTGNNEAIGSHRDIATLVGYDHETCLAISASLDKNVMFWDMRTAIPIASQINLGAEVESMSLSGFHLVVAVGGSVHIYDLRNLERPVHSKHSCMDVRIKCISSIPDSKGYAVGSVDGRVALEFIYPSNSNKGYAFRCHPKSKDGRAHIVSVNDIVFNPCVCSTFITGDNDGYIIAWSDESKRKLHEFSRCPNGVASLSFNHAGELLAIASCSYREDDELEVPPQIFIQKLDDSLIIS